MAYTAKDWRDAPDATTPLQATALEDMERRVANYADAAAATTAAGGIELGSAEYEGAPNWSTNTVLPSVTDIPSTSASVTVRTRPLMVYCYVASGRSTSPYGGGIYLAINNVTTGLMCEMAPVSTGGVVQAGGSPPLVGARRLSLAAGTVTFKLQAANASTGTLTLNCDDGTGTKQPPILLEVIEV